MHLLQAIRSMRSTLNTIPIIVWVFVLVYLVGMIVLSIAQYVGFTYNGYDLAIFDQVLWNSAHGNLYGYSFNYHSYIIDHRAWLLMALVPLYWVVPHPITLLVVQTLVIAVGALVLYQLSQQLLKNVSNRWQKRVGVWIVALYLLHPSIQSMQLYEFHMLPFVLPLSFALWLSVMREQWWRVLFFAVLLLLVREDVALMVFGIGLLLVVQRAARRFGVAMMVMSIVWFLAMIWVGAFVNPDQSSKFFVFYDWLGATPQEAIHTIFSHPLQSFAVLFDYDHSLVLFFFFASIGFLSTLRLRYLLPAVGPLMLFLFIDQNMLAPVFKSHYAAVIVPWFFISALYGVERLYQWMQAQPSTHWMKHYQLSFLPWLGVSIMVIAHIGMLSPLWNVAHSFSLVQYRDLQNYRTVIERIDPDDSVLVSERFYTYLAQRTAVYPSLHLFTGKQHFSAVDYTLPTDLDWVIIENESVLRYGIHLPFENRINAWNRLQQLVQMNDLALLEFNEDYVVYGRLQDGQVGIVNDPFGFDDSMRSEEFNGPSALLHNDIVFDGWVQLSSELHQSELGLRFHSAEKRRLEADDQHLFFEWRDATGVVIKEKFIPLGYGWYPSHAWSQDARQQLFFRVPLEHPKNATQLTLSIGFIEKQFGPLFTVWAADPVMESGAFSVDLSALVE